MLFLIEDVSQNRSIVLEYRFEDLHSSSNILVFGPLHCAATLLIAPTRWLHTAVTTYSERLQGDRDSLPFQQLGCQVGQLYSPSMFHQASGSGQGQYFVGADAQGALGSSVVAQQQIVDEAEDLLHDRILTCVVAAFELDTRQFMSK